MAKHTVVRNSGRREIYLHCINMASLYHKWVSQRDDTRSTITNHYSLFITLITLYCWEMVFKGKRLIYITMVYEHITSQKSKLCHLPHGTHSLCSRNSLQCASTNVHTLGTGSKWLQTNRCNLYRMILSVLDQRKCEYLKDYSLDFKYAYMTTYLASWKACQY